MIYLIGGSPRCGKTILAHQLSSKKRISFLSTDALRPMVLAVTPKSEIKKKFPQIDMPTTDNEFRFDVYSATAMLRAQIVEAKTMWPATKALIRSLIYRKQDFVLEGVHLFPDLVQQLRKGKSVWKYIRLVFLVKTDLEKIESGFSKEIAVFDWMYPSIKNDPVRLRKAANMVREKSLYIQMEAKKYRFRVYNTEKNFHQNIHAAQKYLIG